MNAPAPRFAYFLDALAALDGALPGRRLPWLAELRAQARATFAATGLPTLADEDWKYTSVAPIEQGDFRLMPAPAPEVDPARIDELALPGCHLLVFVDGRHVPALSQLDALPPGVAVAGHAATLERDPEALQSWLGRPLHGAAGGRAAAFAALNAACMADGACIHLAQGVALEAPLHLLFVAATAGLATHCRNTVIAESGSRAAIVEHHATLDAASYFTNVVTDICIGRGAAIEHHKVQEEGAQACHVAAVNADLGRDSRFASSSFALGGALARTDIAVELNAEGAQCALDGLYLAGGSQHIDHHTKIDHARPRGTSRELYKGVLDDSARGVFNGRVIVHVGAQHSDAAQSNRNLLLSPLAEIDTKPQLEIWADDVKCSHAATVGQLDAEQIFYLRSRGLDDGAARALLTWAFAAEMVERQRLAPLRARLEVLLRARLPGLPETREAHS